MQLLAARRLAKVVEVVFQVIKKTKLHRSIHFEIFIVYLVQKLEQSCYMGVFSILVEFHWCIGFIGAKQAVFYS